MCVGHIFCCSPCFRHRGFDMGNGSLIFRYGGTQYYRTNYPKDRRQHLWCRPLRLNRIMEPICGLWSGKCLCSCIKVSRPAPTRSKHRDFIVGGGTGDLSMMGLGYDKWNIAYLARGEGQATCSIENYDSSVTYVWSSTLPPYTGEGFTFTVDFASDTDEPVLHDIECRVLKNGLSTSSGVHLALIPQGYSY